MRRTGLASFTQRFSQWRDPPAAWAPGSARAADTSSQVRERLHAALRSGGAVGHSPQAAATELIFEEVTTVQGGLGRAARAYVKLEVVAYDR